MNTITPDALAQAAPAIETLQAAGVRVSSIAANGRRLVLHTDRRPPFVRGAVTRRHLTAEGLIRRYAAPYRGLQLEWQETTPLVREAGHA